MRHEGANDCVSYLHGVAERHWIGYPVMLKDHCQLGVLVIARGLTRREADQLKAMIDSLVIEDVEVQTAPAVVR